MENKSETVAVETKESIPQIKEENKENPIVETQEQINWKRFREQREIERKQREAAEKKALEKAAEADALKAAMEAILNKQQPTHQESNELEDLSDDQKIDKRIAAALAAKEEEMNLRRQQKEYAELPNRLAQNFSDFNQVCSSDNLDYLEYHYPEVASAFKNSPDSYEKWVAVYKTVKRFVPNTESKKDQEKAEKNFNKPQSMTVPGVTQVGDSAPMYIDDKRRADNWARMQRVMKGAK